MARKKNGKDIPQEAMESAHRVWLAGLGALARAEEEGGRFFRRLVEQGEDVESRGREKVEEVVRGARGAADDVRRQVDEAKNKVRAGVKSRGGDLPGDIGRMVDERVEGLLRRLGIPSRSEIESLTERVERLNRHIETLTGGAGATSGAAPEPPLAETPPARRVSDAPVPGGAARPAASKSSRSSKPAPVKSGKPAPKSATPREVAPEAVELTKGEGTKGASSGGGKKAAPRAQPPKKTAATRVTATKTGPAKAPKGKGSKKDEAAGD